MEVGKEYEISTIQDIFDIVTTENIDRFMTDFYKMFDSIAKLKQNLESQTLVNMTMPSYTWTDDGKMNLSATLNGEIIE